MEMETLESVLLSNRASVPAALFPLWPTGGRLVLLLGAQVVLQIHPNTPPELVHPIREYHHSFLTNVFMEKKETYGFADVAVLLLTSPVFLFHIV